MIFTYIITAVLVVVSLIVQGHPSFDVIKIAGVKPDLLFIVIVYMAYSFGSFYGEVVGFAGGLLHDAVSNAPLGFLALPKVIVAFVVGMFGRAVFKSTLLTVILLIFISSLAKGLITLMLAYIFNEGAISSVLSIIVPEAFYNALVAPLLFLIFDKIFEGELEHEGYY